jgi:hypothetical protein
LDQSHFPSRRDEEAEDESIRYAIRTKRDGDLNL